MSVGVAHPWQVSFFRYEGRPYVIVGSKNVILAVSASSAEAALADLAAYAEPRYGFAREMCEVFVRHLFGGMRAEQRESLIAFACERGATLCGESISPAHQHIQSYRLAGGPEIPGHAAIFEIAEHAGWPVPRDS